MPLSCGVPAAGRAKPIHDAFRDEQAIKCRCRKDFMCVLIMPVAHTVRRASLAIEIETRVDKVLAVWEEKFHWPHLCVLR